MKSKGTEERVMDEGLHEEGRSFPSRMSRMVARMLKEPLVANSINLLLNAFAAAVMGFVFMLVITNTFDAYDVGLYSAAISAAGLLAVLSRMGLDIGMIRFLPDSQEPNDLIGTCLSVGILASIPLALIFIAGTSVWSPVLDVIGRDLPLLFAFIGVTVATAATYLQYSLLVAKRTTSVIVVRDMVRDVAKIAVVVAIIPLGVVGILGASLIGMTLSFMMASLALRRIDPGYRPHWRIQKRIVTGILRYSLNNHVAVLLGNVPNLLLPILVVDLLGAEQGAYFYVAWSIALLIFVGSGAVATSFFANGAHAPQDLAASARRSLKISMLLLVPTAVAVLLFGRDLLSIFGAGYSANSTELLWVLGVASIPYAYNEVRANVKKITMEMRPLLIYNVIGAVGIILFSILLMGPLGLVGVGIGFLAAELVRAAFTAWSEGMLRTRA